MAKLGMNYYNVDTDRYADRKIKRLVHTFGCSGLAVYDYILCEVYRDKGCVLEWDEDTAFDVARYFGLKETTVKEIVRYCGVVGLFDATLLSGGIITSLAIQKRYLDMCNRAKRSNCDIPEKWRLIPEKFPKIPEKTEKTTEVFHKVNNSKVKEKEPKGSLSNAHTCASEEERERFLEIFTFELNFQNPKAEVTRFVAHYDASGWCRKGDSVPVRNKEALAKTWKPQAEGARYPEEFRQWLAATYENAKATDPEAATRLFEVSGAQVSVENGTKHIRVHCTRGAAQVMETYFATLPQWRMSYRIPN